MAVDNLNAPMGFIHEREAGRFLAWLACESSLTGPVNGCCPGTASVADLLGHVQARSGKVALLSPPAIRPLQRHPGLQHRHPPGPGRRLFLFRPCKAGFPACWTAVFSRRSGACSHDLPALRSSALRLVLETWSVALPDIGQAFLSVILAAARSSSLSLSGNSAPPFALEKVTAPKRFIPDVLKNSFIARRPAALSAKQRKGERGIARR